MAWEATLIWPEVCAESDEYDEDQAVLADADLLNPNWGMWRATLAEDAEIEQRLRSAGCGALLAYTTEGREPHEIEWVSPDDIVRSATRLKKLIADGDPLAEDVLEVYEDQADSGAPALVLFVDDLDQIIQAAQRAGARGHTRLTFQIDY